MEEVVVEEEADVLRGFAPRCSGAVPPKPCEMERPFGRQTARTISREKQVPVWSFSLNCLSSSLW